MYYLKSLFCFSLLLFSIVLSAQDYDDGAQNLNAMSIPSSPAFSLLGVNPEIVTRPSDVKEFKVDWRIKNYKLAPDLALETQPLWWLHYRNKTPKELYEASPVERVLSTTSLSLATAKIDNVNHMAFALKFNLYKGYDPFSDINMITNNEEALYEEIIPLSQQIDSLEILSAEETNFDDKIELAEEIAVLRYQKKSLLKSNMDNFAEECNQAIRDRWNMDMVDFAFGCVYKYNNAGLDSLKFESAGYGLWINAAKGVGENSLWTGILKVNRIGSNTDFLLGGAYRFGNHKYNFFGELVLASIGNNPLNGFDEDEQFADLRAQDIGSAWYKFSDDGESATRWTLSYGGDFKLSRNVLLNFALRTDLSGSFSFEQFLPIANLVCLMH